MIALIIEWLIINILLGICIASIGAHQRISNLDLKISLSIGLTSGIVADLILLLLYLFRVQELFSIACSTIGLILTGIILVLWSFSRDPNRTITNDLSSILSPADGIIIYIREVKKCDIPCSIKGKAHIKLNEIVKTDILKNENNYLIGINMSILDVHVNRAPIDGKVVFVKPTKGELLSLKNWMSDVKNERNTIIIKKDMLYVGIVQIANRIIGKIISYVQEGDLVNKGQRIGKISWGSQVDVVLPQEYVKILVKEGDHVYAGETAIAKVLEAKDESCC